MKCDCECELESRKIYCINTEQNQTSAIVVGHLLPVDRTLGCASDLT